MSLMFCERFLFEGSRVDFTDIHVTRAPLILQGEVGPFQVEICGAPATKCVSAFLLNYSGRKEVRRT